MGATIDTQRRSGNVLPPPLDEFCNNSCSSSVHNKSSTENLDISSENILESSVWQTPASSVRGSPAAASWGARASNSQPATTSMASSNGPFKQKSDTCSISVAFSTAVVSPAKVSIMHSDSGKKLNGEIWSPVQRNSGPVASVEILDVDKQQKPSNTSAKIGHSDKLVTSSKTSTPSPKVDGSMSMPDIMGQSCGINSERDSHVPVESKVQELCSDISSLNIITQGPQHTQYRELLSSYTAAKDAPSSKDFVAPKDQPKLKLEPPLEVAESDTCKAKDDVTSFDIQRRGDPEVTNHTDNLHNLGQLSGSSRVLYSQEAFHLPNINNSNNVDKKPSKFSVPQAYNAPVISNGYAGNWTRSFTDLDTSANNSSYMLPNESNMMHDGIRGELVNHDNISGNDMGESSIISNILSMDFDPWDESLTSPQNLAKLLGETDKQLGSLGASNSKKVQNSNQSRFSFAREEHQTSNFEPSFTGFEQTLRNHSFTNGFKDNGNYYDGGTGNGYSTLCAQQPGNFASIHPHNSPNRFSVSRAPVTAPPGFSGPTRAPPPGFSSFERMEQTFDINSGNHLLNNSSFLRNASQSPSTIYNDSANADIEFIDPAILAVGKGRLPGGLNSPGLDMRSTYPTQMSNYENEARLQLLMQRSLSPQQNSRYVEMGDSFSSHTDSYGLPPRILDQALGNNGSQYSQFGLPQSRSQLVSSGNWDGWNEVQSGNGSTVAEFLRSERLGVNKYFTGYQDSKYRISSSGDLYNQTYGI